MTFAAGVLVGSVGTLVVSTLAGLLVARFMAAGSDPAAERLWDDEPPTTRPADELAARRRAGGA